jgi:hypothetical protein
MGTVTRRAFLASGAAYLAAPVVGEAQRRAGAHRGRREVLRRRGVGQSFRGYGSWECGGAPGGARSPLRGRFQDRGAGGVTGAGDDPVVREDALGRPARIVGRAIAPLRGA